LHTLTGKSCRKSHYKFAPNHSYVQEVLNVLTMLQIEEHCSRQVDAGFNDVRDRGRVEQCLKDHVAQEKITATSNKACFEVMSSLIILWCQRRRQR